MKTIRIGIFGVRRGSDFFKSILYNGGEIVAICEKNQERVEGALKQLGDRVAVYDDFDKFIEHPMDAVLLANYFHEHAEYAIKCLEKNIHVLSECTSNATMAEGVALVRAAEKSNAYYMLAENYPFMLFNREMKRVYDGGTLGKVLYAEGEYNHAGNVYSPVGVKDTFDSLKHWRMFLPRTYYLTHSLGPLMYTTGSNPIRVTAMPIQFDPPTDSCRAGYVNEKAAIITCLNDDRSVFKITGHASLGASDNSYRICGDRGQIENVRGSHGWVMLRYNDWQIPEGKKAINYYPPNIPDKDEELIQKSGHGGADFFVIRNFFESIRTETPPKMDVYFATKLASVAILAHRSLLERGVPYDVPDFRLEEDRVKYENDTASPFWYSDGREPTVRCCLDENYAPSEQQKENLLKALTQEGNPN